MKPLIGLLETGSIWHDDYESVVIKDHRVIRGGSLFIRIMRSVIYKPWEFDWANLMGQFEEQGFNFAGIMEYCMTELEESINDDDYKLSTILLPQIYGILTFRNYDRHIISQSLWTVLRKCTIKQMQKCKNWNHFYKVFTVDGDLYRLLDDKIKAELKK